MQYHSSIAVPLLLPIRAKVKNTQGITINDISAEVVRPPITAQAIGELKTELSPKPKVKGISASMVVSEVIKIGLIRRIPAATIASLSSNPSFLS